MNPADEVEIAALKARIVELETELALVRELAFMIHADVELPPELLEVRQRLIADRYAKLAAAEQNAQKNGDTPMPKGDADA